VHYLWQRVFAKLFSNLPKNLGETTHHGGPVTVPPVESMGADTGVFSKGPNVKMEKFHVSLRNWWWLKTGERCVRTN